MLVAYFVAFAACGLMACWGCHKDAWDGERHDAVRDLAVGLGLYGPTAALAACAAVLATFKLVVGRKADEVEAAPAVPTEVA